MLGASCFLFLAIVGSTVATSFLPRDLHEPQPLIYPSNYANATARNNLPRSLGRRQPCTLQLCTGGGCCLFTENCCDEGCCPGTSTCIVLSGVPACCPIGQTCSGSVTGCAQTGYIPCAGDTYCCPSGDTCFRDADGNPRCGGGGTSNSTSTSNSATEDTSSQVHTTLQADTSLADTFTTLAGASTSSAIPVQGTANLGNPNAINGGNNNNNNNNNNNPKTNPTSGSKSLAVSGTVAALAMGAAVLGSTLV